MAWPGTLSEEQQEIVKTFVREQVREAILHIVEAANDSKNTFDTYWGQVSAIFAGLDNGDEIPDGTGLAGAETLTKADVITFMAYISQMGDSATANNLNSQAHRNNYVRVIGGTNMDA